jgi:hypothetical protein
MSGEDRLKKKILLCLSFVALLIGGYCWLGVPACCTNRTVASVPNHYDELTACEKQDILWKRIEGSIHNELPPYSKFGLVQLIKMSFQELQTKGNLHSDFAPERWQKYLHRRGAIAKVKLVPKDSHYTGIFQGADCGLLRLSLTYMAAGERPVAPGLALKILRDHVPSANFSALVSLDGQEKDFNFFKNSMSNIVPASQSIGAKLVHKVFSKVTNYPEELMLEDLGAIGTNGEKVSSPQFPRQVFLIPSADLKFSSTEHEIREDFLSIPPGTVLYQLHAIPDSYRNFNYTEYTPEKAESFRKESVHIADIVTNSDFLASDFGDEGIFFRHQIRP